MTGTHSSVSSAGYLQDQNMDKVAMVFCKASPYLKEEYALLKSGYTAEKLVNFTLIDLLKDFCEVRGIGMCDDL